LVAQKALLCYDLTMANMVPETNSSSVSTSAEKAVINPKPETGLSFESETKDAEKLHAAAQEVGGQITGHETPASVINGDLSHEQFEASESGVLAPSENTGAAVVEDPRKPNKRYGALNPKRYINIIRNMNLRRAKRTAESKSLTAGMQTPSNIVEFKGAQASKQNTANASGEVKNAA